MKEHLSRNKDKNEHTQQHTDKQPVQNESTDERDARIKNEPDTRRLRSERQSVIDGEQNSNNNQP